MCFSRWNLSQWINTCPWVCIPLRLCLLPCWGWQSLRLKPKVHRIINNIWYLSPSKQTMITCDLHQWALYIKLCLCKISRSGMHECYLSGRIQPSSSTTGTFWNGLILVYSSENCSPVKKLTRSMFNNIQFNRYRS